MSPSGSESKEHMELKSLATHFLKEKGFEIIEKEVPVIVNIEVIINLGTNIIKLMSKKRYRMDVLGCSARKPIVIIECGNLHRKRAMELEVLERLGFWKVYKLDWNKKLRTLWGGTIEEILPNRTLSHK